MAEHPVIMDNKQLKVFIKKPGEQDRTIKESVVETTPKVSEPKKTVAQRLSAYAFGEEVEKPAEYVWKSYLEPTGKRVANDIVEYFLQMIKHTFQRWIWHGKILDDGKFGDRTSFSNYSKQEPIKAMVKLSPVKELTFATRIEASKVLDELKATAENEGGYATVRQYYEASGTPQLCESGVSSSSGWSKGMLNKVEIIEQPDGDGFCLKLPRPMSLS